MSRSRFGLAKLRRLHEPGRLRVRGIRAGWGPADTVQGIDFEVGPGERLAVLGPNGAGKTTLFDVLSGRLKARAGSVQLGPQRLGALPLYRRARLGLGYVPQEPTIFGDRTVEENLRAALGAPAAVLRSRPEADAALARSLEHWGLVALADRRASVLSGGERRRVEVARALLLQPKVLLLDEPFAGLDPEGRCRLREALAELPSPRPALVITDHAADDLLGLCDRVLVLLDGKVAFSGPRSVFSPELKAFRRYFGT